MRLGKEMIKLLHLFIEFFSGVLECGVKLGEDDGEWFGSVVFLERWSREVRENC